ncbi:type IV pilus modification protein PilV [Dechloromonas sp. ARDL1]|uniref:type IV pilus modification protein PilV n=1 Tax=Dechloromonas sp. ARDL1 TaxID=3322121 RepID=UPI003DA731AE
MLTVPTSRTKQEGVALLEALVAILIFSIGLLGLVSLQARAIATTSDAKYRSDAAFLANKIIGVMWGDKANLAAYSSGGVAGNVCDAGVAGANANVVAWLDEVGAALPGAVANRQRIVVDAASGQVSIAICWLTSPNATSYHKHEVSARIQDNT